jgi:hypothetical protein
MDGTKNVVLHEGELYWDISDYGILTVAPSDEAKALQRTMSEEEKVNLEGLLAHLQVQQDAAASTPGLLLHPDARASLWGAALANIADHYREMGDNERALFFVGAAWNISHHPIFAYNTALLSLNVGDVVRAKNLLQVYIGQYRNVLKNPTLMLAFPGVTSDELERLATSAESRLADIAAL